MKTDNSYSAYDTHIEQSKVWSITTPQEAAIVTKSAYGDGAIEEVRQRKAFALNKGDFSTGSFWYQAEKLLMGDSCKIDQGVIDAKIRLEKYIQALITQ